MDSVRSTVQDASGHRADARAVGAELQRIAAISYPSDRPVYHVIARTSGPGRKVTAASYTQLSDAVLRAVTENDRGANLYTFHQTLWLKGVMWARPPGRHDRRWPLPMGTWANGDPPSMEDVDRLNCFLVDIDPAGTAAAMVDSDRCQALEALRDLAGRLQMPYFLLDSGRGVQGGFYPPEPIDWVLRTDRRHDRRVDAERLAERIVASLRSTLPAERFSVDDVSNANRFTRLAGTVNQKTGRVSAMLEVTK